MKKLAMILVGIFVVGQSFVMADEILSPEEMACIKKGGNFSYENKKCEFSITNTSGETKNSETDSGTQIIEPKLEPKIITSGKIETGGKIVVDSGSSPETTGKIITSETQNNKTTIISILVVLIGIGLIITAFRLRKLNQKNENPLPPQ